jgi:hypothetical protein
MLGEPGGTVGAAIAKARLTPASKATSSGSPTCGTSKAGLRIISGQQRLIQCLLDGGKQFSLLLAIGNGILVPVYG